MTQPDKREDGDPLVDMDAAARFRQILQRRVQDTPDPLHQSLMDLMSYGEVYGIETTMDYDDDFSDISDDW